MMGYKYVTYHLILVPKVDRMCNLDLGKQIFFSMYIFGNLKSLSRKFECIFVYILAIESPKRSYCAKYTKLS